MGKNKIAQQINDVVSDNIQKLADVFPSAVKDGQVDFNALREEFGQFQDEFIEKYELTWVGKKEAKKNVQEDIVGRTLKFFYNESVNPETTKNIYIEGENLEVLKLLRQNYYGAIKMIYIDPPYNTGNDFVYNDDFSIDETQSKIDEGEISEEGERLVVNSRSSNRFHAKWLSMMYSRVKVAKDLLKDDGVIFISIDDNEQTNMRKICDEIFGEGNFIAQCVRKRRDSQANLSKNISPIHEYILIYAKQNGDILKKVKANIDESEYKNPDNDPRGPYKTMPCTNKGGQVYTVKTPTGKEIKEEWRFKEETYYSLLNDNRLVFPRGGEGKPRYKLFLYEKMEEGQLANTWLDNLGSNQEATRELKSIFGEKVIFDTPKPTGLLKFCMELATDKDSLILDFFAGSCSTAHAVMQLNAEDGGNRSFIMVQMDELCDERTEAYKQGYINICEIGKERMRRVGKIILDKFNDKNIDIGFKVFKTSDTNIKWNSLVTSGQLNLTQIESTPDLMDFMPDSKDIDIVYELMLRQRDVPLSEKLELLSEVGERTYLYADTYLVCLDSKITEEMVDKLAGLDPVPVKFIFRDSAFGDDIALKDETFRRLKAVIDKNACGAKVSYTVEFI